MAVSNYLKEVQGGLWGYVGINPHEFNLPITIFVDVNRSFEYYNHQPCLYIPVEYTSCLKVIPISLTTTPEILANLFDLNIYQSDLYKIYDFISKNNKLLIALASEKLDYRDFYRRIKLVHEEKILLTEAPVLSKYKTGLPLEIWIDKGNCFELTKHGPRVKFKSNDSPDPHTWASFTLPDLKIPKKHKVNVPERDIKKICQLHPPKRGV